MRATAAVFRPNGATPDLEEVELDEPRTDEVLVEMVASGVCHTDLSAGRGSTPFPLPGVAGHEGAGVVSAVGKGVHHVSPGDRVLLTFTSCGGCDTCIASRPAYCRSFGPMNFGGSRSDGSSLMTDSSGSPIAGRFLGQSSFMSHALVDGRSAVAVDVDVDDLIDLAPLGCAVQTGVGAVLNELHPGTDASLVIFGAGAVGLSAVMAARQVGVERIVVVDLLTDRLELASELGATEVVDATSLEAAFDLVGDEGGFDYAIEATGNPDVLRMAVEVTNSTGTTAVIGAPPQGTTVELDVNWIKRGRSVQGITEGGSNPPEFIPELVEMYDGGKLPLRRLVVRYPFSEIGSALEDARSGAVVKPVLVFDRAKSSNEGSAG